MPDDKPTGKPITRESVRPMSRSGGDLTVAAVANAVENALKPGCFFVAPGCKLRVSHEPREEIPWELFAGHLLGETKRLAASHTPGLRSSKRAICPLRGSRGQGVVTKNHSDGILEPTPIE